jgi:hypothetical protein
LKKRPGSQKIGWNAGPKIPVCACAKLAALYPAHLKALHCSVMKRPAYTLPAVMGVDRQSQQRAVRRHLQADQQQGKPDKLALDESQEMILAISGLKRDLAKPGWRYRPTGAIGSTIECTIPKIEQGRLINRRII